MTTTLLSTARPDSNPGAAFAIRWSDSNGLSIPVNGGFQQAGGYWRSVSRANVMLVDNTTTYIEISQDGAIQAHAGGFTTGNTPLYAISVASSIITNISDRRLGQQTINGNTAPVFSTAVTLTDAQIKEVSGSQTNLLELVAAPGVGKAICFLSATVLSSFSVAYTNISANDTAMDFKIGTYTVSGYSENGGPNTATDWDILFGSTTPAIRQFSPRVATAPDVGIATSSSAFINQPLNLELYNGAGSLTGGSDANTLTVVILYFIVNA